MKSLGSPEKMINLAAKSIFVLTLVGGFLPGCAQIKETFRTIGHTTRDVSKEIGHGARDITREIGHGTREVARDVADGTRDATQAAAEEVKKVVKPAPPSSQY